MFDLTRPARLLPLLAIPLLALGMLLWRFSTVRAQETGVHPAPNDHTVALTSTVGMVYSTTIDAATVNTRTFAVHGMQSGQRTGSYQVNGGAIVFTPGQPFNPGEWIHASATTGTLFLDGSRPLTPTVWQARAAAHGGTGIFQTGPTLGNSSSWAVALGDLDGDGDLDAFLANQGEPGQIWVNDGNGGFTDSGQTLSHPDGSATNQAVALGDLDGDGDLDAFGAYSSGANLVWVNDGAGNFGDSGQQLSDRLSQAVALGDLDGDGDLDAFVANNFDPSVVWLNSGGLQGGTPGRFTDSGQRLTSSRTVALGDLDGDGDLDAFVGDRVLRNDGDGVLRETLNLGSARWDVALGDVDGDGDLDAFGAANAPPEVWVNDGNGNFTESGQQLGTLPATRVALGDLDGDGDLDAFVVNNDVDTNQQVWLNDGTGAFSAAGENPQGGSFGVALGDLDGDGDLDAFGANDGPNPLWLNGGSTPPPSPTGDWQIQTLDVRGEMGEFTSLALDAEGRPHISYYDRTNGDLKYAVFDGIYWHFEEVETTGNAGTFNSLALDGDGVPHVSYYDETNGALKYARRGESGWQVETVDDSATSVGLDTSLALDGDGVPHISYYDSTNPSLKYAHRRNGIWEIESVDDAGNVGAYTSLALDGDGFPHISYQDLDNHDLKYARWDGAAWQLQTVDADGVVGRDTSLALDGSGRPHISYLATAGLDGRLKYARWDGAAWQIETVDDGTGTALFPSAGFDSDLALDTDGRPHISYRDAGHGALRYARWDGTSWQIEVVDTVLDVGQYTSLALDGNGVPHISYYDVYFGDLRYTSRTGAWQVRVVEESGIHRQPSLALHGKTAAAGYHSHEASGNLNLATWEQGQWNRVPITPLAQGNSFVSLRLNGQGQPRATYYDPVEGALVYARWDGSSWATQIVDRSDDDGQVSARSVLLLDGDSPTVVYTYWDFTFARVQLAQWDGTRWVRRVNDVGPQRTALGRFSAVRLGNGDVAVGYHDAVAGDLRLATWRAGEFRWTDELIDGGNGSDVGGLNALARAVGTVDGRPRDFLAVAYVANGGIRYAYQFDQTWRNQTAVAGAGNGEIAYLTLNLADDSRFRPHIAYTTGDDPVLHLLSANGGSWQETFQWSSETVEGLGAGSPPEFSLAFDDRERFVYRGTNGGLRFAFRTVEVVPPAPAHSGGSGSGTPYGLGCLCFLFPIDCAGVRSRFPGDVQAAPLDDTSVFARLTDQFAASTEGARLIDLYVEHVGEMRDVLLSDPQLMWDSYRVLQNYMPGLEAMVSGRGDEVTFDEALIEQARNIWMRMAGIAEAADPNSPLAAAIEAELARHEDLQIFVDMTFSEGAEAIGVMADGGQMPLYLPFVAHE